MARVYAVGSAKGGVGKTTTAANLAAALAAAGEHVVAVDADLGMPNLAGAFGATHGDATLHGVLAGTDAVEEALVETAAGVALVPGAPDIDAYREARPAGLSGVLEELSGYDAVVVDTSAGLSHDTLVPLGLADEVVLVTTPDEAAVEDTARTLEVADRVGASVRGVVVTRVTPETDVDAIGDRLGVEVLGSVPEDAAVAAVDGADRPVVLRDPSAPPALAYARIAEALAGVTVPTPDAEAETETSSEPPADAGEDADEEAGEEAVVEEDVGEEPAAGADGDADLDESSDEDADEEVESDAGEEDEEAGSDADEEAEDAEPAGDRDVSDDVPIESVTVPGDDDLETDTGDAAGIVEEASDPATTSVIEEAEPATASPDTDTEDSETDADAEDAEAGDSETDADAEDAEAGDDAAGTPASAVPFASDDADRGAASADESVDPGAEPDAGSDAEGDDGDEEESKGFLRRLFG